MDRSWRASPSRSLRIPSTAVPAEGLAEFACRAMGSLLMLGTCIALYAKTAFAVAFSGPGLSQCERISSLLPSYQRNTAHIFTAGH